VDAAADDDLASGPRLLARTALAVGDADRLCPLEQDFGRQRLGLDLEVRAVLGLAEIGRGSAPAPRILHRALEMPGAVLVAAVEIVVGRHASLDRGLDKMLGELPAHRVLRHAQRAAD